jgi:hypothetical protein
MHAAALARLLGSGFYPEPGACQYVYIHIQPDRVEHAHYHCHTYAHHDADTARYCYVDHQ